MYVYMMYVTDVFDDKKMRSLCVLEIILSL
jgi:hypothetical protein